MQEILRRIDFVKRGRQQNNVGRHALPHHDDRVPAVVIPLSGVEVLHVLSRDHPPVIYSAVRTPAPSRTILRTLLPSAYRLRAVLTPIPAGLSVPHSAPPFPYSVPYCACIPCAVPYYSPVPSCTIPRAVRERGFTN